MAAAQRRSGGNPVNELIELVKVYVKQETVGPLKGLGRWVGMGIGGALLLGLGLIELTLALLRVLQEEAGGVFDGNWSWVPYVIALLFVGIVTAISLSRIKRHGLDRKEVGR